MTPYNKSIPLLRFAEFTEQWTSKQLHEICDKLSVGFVGTCEKYYTDKSNGILLVRTGNLFDGQIVLNNVKYVEEEFHLKNKKSQIFPGDLLIARHGTSGQAALVPKKFPQSNCLNIVILRANRYFDSYFLQNKFNSEVLQKQIKRKTAGTTQGVINTGELSTLTVSYPTLFEQQKIASFLSSIDQKIQQLNRKKELLEQYKKGVMQQLFSGKLRFKDENGKAYPKWEEKKLGNLVQIRSGFSPSHYKLLETGKYPFLKVEELNNSGKYQYKSRFYTNNGDDVIKRHSIVFPKRGAAILNNKVRINSVDVLIDTNLMALTPIKGLLHFEFLYYKIYAEKLYKIADCSSIPQINNKHIEPYKIQSPSYREQQKIADFLSNLDSKIEIVNSQIAKSQQFKKGLLQQMFV